MLQLSLWSFSFPLQTQQLATHEGVVYNRPRESDTGFKLGWDLHLGVVVHNRPMESDIGFKLGWDLRLVHN
nr:hypothetical protein CFP56_38272 [Quercus suber]